MSGRIGCVIVAAGRGERMGADVNKVLLPLNGEAVLRHTVRAFEQAAEVSEICVVASPNEVSCVRELTKEFCKVARVVAGGATRQQSVQNGLRALSADCEFVMVQDGARPMTSQCLIAQCAQALRTHGSAVACTLVTDTIKRVNGDDVQETLDRAQLRAVQTPQCFALQPLLAAYEKAERDGISVTDDASVMEYAGERVQLVVCADYNGKLTTPSDLTLMRALMKEKTEMERMPRTGFGYDVHQLVQGRRLVLCGVEIPYEKGLLGHSDADVAVHALMDALLGAACMGDIGRLYPDNDPTTEGIDSMVLLRDVVSRLKGFTIVHADITIVAQKPKLMPYIPRMTEVLQREMPGTALNIKATTTEHLGFEGRGEGIAAQAVATIW